VSAGGRVHGDGLEVGQNEEELEGNRFRFLPWSGTARGVGSAALGGGRLWWSVVVALGGLGGREARLGRCVARWGRAGLFIGAGRSVRGDILSFTELHWPGNGDSGKIPASTPAGRILGRFGAV
jgi:hypothetical protein